MRRLPAILQLTISMLTITLHAQTVHVDDDKIVYKGAVQIKDISRAELISRAEAAIAQYVAGSSQPLIRADSNSTMIESHGSIRLPSSYSLIRTIEYRILLTVDGDKFGYKIDSVFLKEIERGGKTSIVPAKELLKGMDVSGPVAAKTEKQLNEIDMNFQKVVDLVSRRIKQGPL